MKFHQAGLIAGGFLLIAAQDAPTPPAEKSTFSEAFAEQSNAAKAVQTAQELGEPELVPVEPAAEPAPASSETVDAPPEAGAPLAEPTAEPPASSEPSPVEADATPKLAKGDPVTRDFLVGIWTEPGKSCEAGIDFQADGKMIGPFPRWELADGELTMVGNRQKMRLTVVDKDTMQSRRSETDPPRTLKRCPKAPPPPKS